MAIPKAKFIGSPARTRPLRAPKSGHQAQNDTDIARAQKEMLKYRWLPERSRGRDSSEDARVGLKYELGVANKTP